MHKLTNTNTSCCDTLRRILGLGGLQCTFSLALAPFVFSSRKLILIALIATFVSMFDTKVAIRARTRTVVSIRIQKAWMHVLVATLCTET